MTKAQIVSQHLSSDQFIAYQAKMDPYQKWVVEAYHKGYILQNNSGTKSVIVFKWRGNQYATSTTRTKAYSLDANWQLLSTSIVHKLWLVLTKRAHKLNPSKKAILAGVV